MTARTPVYWDGSDLRQLSTSEITEYVTQTIYQYSLAPNPVLTVVSSSGNISPTMADTRKISGAAAQQASSNPSEGQTAEPGTITTNYDKVTQTVTDVSMTTDTDSKAFPVFYDSTTGGLQAMSADDFIDTFCKPAVDKLTAASESSDTAGTYSVNTSSSVTNYTEVSGTNTAIFVDTRANTGQFSASNIGTAGSTQDFPSTINSYYLIRRNGVDNSPSRTLLTIDSDNNLKQLAEADIESLLQTAIRHTTSNVNSYKITYNFDGSGNARGSSVVDTNLDGSGAHNTRDVGADDYRAQEFPNGSAQTVNTYVFKINQS